MRLFGRKKKKEEDTPRKKTLRRTKGGFSDEGEEKERSVKELLLRSTRSRKKKGEIETWTKKERFFVLVIFLGTVTTSAFLGMNAREWKLPNFPRLQLPTILSEETILIEGAPTESLEEDVAAKFEELTKPLSGVYGFFVIRMKNGSFYGSNQKEVFEAASVNKLPAMLAMYKEAERGNVNLSSEYVLKEEDKIEGSGSLAEREEGSRITYGELVELMGKKSDNTAFGIVKKILGDDVILQTMNDFGLPATLQSNNEVSPYEVGYFFKKLLDAKEVSRETRDAILNSLTDTIYEDWISRDLPVDVAHKYGTLPHVKNVVEKEADAIIPEISAMIYSIEQ